MTVTEIHFASSKTRATGLIHVEPHDIVMVTLGSMTASSSIGANTTPPKPLPTPETAKAAPDGAWELWFTLASPDGNPQFWSDFGGPANFYTRVNESNWLSDTLSSSKNMRSGPATKPELEHSSLSKTVPG
jgi:oleate hydratase